MPRGSFRRSKHLTIRSWEIFVDYIVARRRLWIRRVYDNTTAPIEGLVIDPKWAAVNWDEAESTISKAVYRRLTEGRWIVTVTGDGSLGLAKIEGPVELATPPRIKDYEELHSDLDADLEHIGPATVLEKLIVPEG